MKHSRLLTFQEGIPIHTKVVACPVCQARMEVYAEACRMPRVSLAHVRQYGERWNPVLGFLALVRWMLVPHWGTKLTEGDCVVCPRMHLSRVTGGRLVREPGCVDTE